ncbi:hypothetical protein PQR66_18975 [Paraburkholderia agricolaris]|uniref:Uncharacterized protein n=1 Tax=Paraburkholderia agricolaris TaxID=2152888 RepID=A0ABW8ZS59_9BURK
MNVADVDAPKAKLDTLRPLPQNALCNLRDEQVFRWTYRSNTIAGHPGVSLTVVRRH